MFILMNYYLEPLKEYLDNMSLKAQNLSIGNLNNFFLYKKRKYLAKYENDIHLAKIKIKIMKNKTSGCSS